MRRKLPLIVSTHLAVLGLVLFLPALAPRILEVIHPDIIFRIPSIDRSIYLTIDDSPSADTESIVRILRKHDVPATFFIIGNRASEPSKLRQIQDSGFSLGNHLRSTTKCSQLSIEQFKADLDSTSSLIGLNRTKYFRPPSDFGTTEQLKIAKESGYRTIVGTVFPLDHWIENKTTKYILVRWLATNGGVIILHDGAGRGSRTAELLDLLIPELKEAGYIFKPLP